MDSTLTVITPASDYNLVSLATMKDELGITDTSQDTRLLRWISEESDHIMQFCDRVFAVETVRETFYANAWPLVWRAGCLPRALVLSRRPLVSVSSVTVDGAALDASAYEVDSATMLWRKSSTSRIWWTGSTVVITYVGGYATIPGTLQSACMDLVKDRSAQRTREAGLRSVQIEGVGRKDFWVGTTNGNLNSADMPSSIAAKLARYQELVAV